MKKPTEAERAAITEYGKKLAARMEELCITQEKLAKAIGKSQKTVSRYLSGENQSLPPQEVQEQIERYLKRQANYIYRHMSSEEFAAVMRETLEKYGISQAELAEQILIHAPTRKKIDQRMISHCINGTVPISTWDQYMIRCEMESIHERKRKEREAAARYGEELFARMKDLGVDPREFAKELSVSPEQMERWRRGEETVISFALAEEIPRFLEKKSLWQGYRHMPADEFGELLEKLLLQLPHMTPEGFAKRCFRTEEAIAQYLKGGCASTREQWEMLRYCHREYRKLAGSSPFPELEEWIRGLRDGRGAGA